MYMNRDYKDAGVREIESCGQGYVYINRHRNVF